MRHRMQPIKYYRWRRNQPFVLLPIGTCRYQRKRGEYWFIVRHRYESFGECRYRWQAQRAGWYSRLQAWKRSQ